MGQTFWLVSSLHEQRRVTRRQRGERHLSRSRHRREAIAHPLTPTPSPGGRGKECRGEGARSTVVRRSRNDKNWRPRRARGLYAVISDTTASTGIASPNFPATASHQRVDILDPVDAATAKQALQPERAAAAGS
ncbi:MAG: hypothetical protein MZV70_41780 [Desulfobacterales bacterium]|nr:hypothetical protein [Desulfobacterales bacterium]